MKRGNVKALLPIGVFLILYLGLGILFEYGLQIPMGFYNIPIVVAFLAALLVACLQNRALSLDDKLLLMGKGVGDKNIIIMILIFLTAGIFVGVVGRSSADSVAYFLLSLVPAHHPDHPHRPVCGRGLRLLHSPVCGLCHGRGHVWGQPLLYLRHHHRRLQRPGLPHAG